MPKTAEYAIDPEAVLWSAPPQLRAGRPLLVLMHGWSYTETHLFRLIRQLPSHLVVASLRAPFAEAGGYAWFPRIGNPIGDPKPDVANRATLAVLSWFDTLPQHESIGLLGFSQGGAMALQLLRHAPDRFGYAINLGGFVVNDKLPGDAKLATAKPPVLWGRGEDDGVIPGSALDRTQAWLADHANSDVRVYSGLGHDVAGQEIVDVTEFVGARL